MKLFILVFCAFLIWCDLGAQSYHHVDSITRRYPRSFWSPEKLAKRINDDFHSDSTRARAIYTWMATHISYDVNKFKQIKKKKYIDKLARSIRPFNVETYHKKAALRTLRIKKGVCGDYAILYQRLCQLTGLECEIITGSAKTMIDDLGKMPRVIDHGWNAVRINNKWRLIDVTWGAGTVNTRTQKFRFSFDTAYFLTPPDLFALKHYPKNSKWLMTPMSDSLFAALPLYYTLRNDLTILEPSSGLIDAKSRYGIRFKIRCANDHSWVYKYSKGKDFNFVTASREGDVMVFYVPLSSSRNDYLTLYCDDTALATFKVRSKQFIRMPFAGLRGYNVAKN